MAEHTILVTGSSGYIGSAICADLSRDNKVIGLSQRMPLMRQQNATPRARWKTADVADAAGVDSIFRQCAAQGDAIEYVVHFAAYYHFGKNWRPQYYETNVRGTRNIIEAAHRAGVKRIIFAGSITSLEPPPVGQVLTEKSRPGHGIAYSKSKGMGEQLLADNADRVPAIVLRLGGVFSDWCELPPLYSVMKMWSQPVLGLMVPGKGRSGFPYIHRHDVVQMIRRVIEMEKSLDRFDTFFASEDGCTCHNDLFPVIRRTCGANFSTTPIHIPPVFARMTLHGKYLINTLRKKKTYERTWMIDYVDRPLVVDTTYTRNTLRWTPTPHLHILKRLPVLMNHFHKRRSRWEVRNIRRNERRYRYEPDIVSESAVSADGPV